MCKYRPEKAYGYSQGSQARKQGKTIDVNPYLENTRAYTAWRIGWYHENAALGPGKYEPACVSDLHERVAS